MSRIGKKPISIPSGLEVKIDGSSLKFKKSNNEKELDLVSGSDLSILQLLLELGHCCHDFQGSHIVDVQVSEFSQDRIFRPFCKKRHLLRHL